MYSAEALISMANGSFKNINNVRVGDKIYNKLSRPVNVTRIHKIDNAPVVEIQLNNGTGVFYSSPSSKIFCHHVHIDGKHHTEYCSIASAYTDGAKLKNSLKILSPNSDVIFTTYDDSNTSLTKTVYCIHTIDSSRSFFVNKVIACCCPDIV
jgi:hypothetical protein